MFYKIPKSLNSEIIEFEKEVNSYISGNINSAELKHSSAPFGVYQQKNSKFMIRIRCAAGMISPLQFKTIGLISQKFGGDEIHITTRQELQIHDVSPSEIIPAIKELQKVGLASRGGGGNTVRNVMASWNSGVSKKEVFDVTSHAVALTNFLISKPDSWKLPRKFKVTFANSNDDNANARVQDLGFVAKIKNGEKGFKVYVAGGMGRNPSPGKILHEFIPETQIFIVAEAVKSIFFKYGNREKRNLARLRFLWEAFGKDKFLNLYNQEVEKLKLNSLSSFDDFDIIENVENKNNSLIPVQTFSEEFELWKKRYVSEQKQEGLFLVETPFLFGNIKNKDVIAIAELLDNFGDNVIRFTMQQNLTIRNVPEKFLGNIFDLVSKIAPLSNSPRLIGNCIACTGSAICKIGICQPRELLKLLKQKLERSDLPLDKLPDLKINFSGCPNSCGQHHVADLGFVGKIKKVNDERKFYYSVVENAKINDDIFSFAKQIDEIPEEKVVDYILKVISYRLSVISIEN